MFHDMPQNPCLSASDLRQRCWPAPLGERRSRNPAVWCITCLFPGPCRLRALCAVVQRLGKGHCDRHPLVTQVRAEASLSLAAGTSRAAACIDACSDQQRGRPLGPTNTARSPLNNLATLDKMAP